MENNKENDPKFIEKLAKVFMHVTNDAFEQASRRAVLICFVLKYFLSISIYIALRNFAWPGVDELWIAISFAYALYGHELYISTKVKEHVIKTILKENSNEETCIEEDTNDKDSSKDT